MVGLSLRWVNHGGSVQGRYGADLCSYPVRGIVLDIQKLYVQTEWGFSVHSPPSLLVLLPHSHLEAGMAKQPKQPSTERSKKSSSLPTRVCQKRQKSKFTRRTNFTKRFALKTR